MKSVIVKNLTIQFDTFDKGADKFTALNVLDEINELLQRTYPDSTPQLFVNAIDDDDIEITDAEATLNDDDNESN
jgi:hypothetical protein